MLNVKDDVNYFVKILPSELVKSVKKTRKTSRNKGTNLKLVEFDLENITASFKLIVFLEEDQSEQRNKLKT